MNPLVLVVEDEPTVLRVTCQYLESAGFRCLTAETAAQGMTVLDSGTIPELLVLDVRLPDLPGPELALRIHTHYPRIPVLFVSGWLDGLADAGRLDILRWGYLPKPFTAPTLAAAARQLLEREGAGLGFQRAPLDDSNPTPPASKD